MKRAVGWGWIGSNPTVQAEPPPAPKPKPHPPTPHEAGRILAEAWADPEWGTLVWLAIVTGVRRGELCTPRWRDIDLSTHVISLSSSIGQRNRETWEKDTKDHQHRRIALDPEAPWAVEVSVGLAGAVGSDGQLRVRVRAHQREAAWAPRYVGNELAGTHQAAATHRQTAAEADEATNLAERERLRAESAQAHALADNLHARAAELQAVDDVRTQWLAHTAGTARVILGPTPGTTCSLSDQRIPCHGPAGISASSWDVHM